MGSMSGMIGVTVGIVLVVLTCSTMWVSTQITVVDKENEWEGHSILPRNEEDEGDENDENLTKNVHHVPPIPQSHRSLTLEKPEESTTTTKKKATTTTSTSTVEPLPDPPLLILHVGPPKTGTTSLQAALSELSKPGGPLEQDNYSYLGKIVTNATALGTTSSYGEGTESLCLTERLAAIARGHPRRVPECWRTFHGTLHYHLDRNRHLVVSDEVFSFSHMLQNRTWESFFRLFPRSLRVVVVFTYRRFFEIVPSHYNQAFKPRPTKKRLFQWPSEGGKRTLTLSEYLEQDHHRNAFEKASAYFDGSFYRHLTDIVSEIRIHDMHHHGGLVLDFVCRVLPNARRTCEAVQTATKAAEAEATEAARDAGNDSTSSSSTTTTTTAATATTTMIAPSSRGRRFNQAALDLDYDILAVAAHERQLIPNRNISSSYSGVSSGNNSTNGNNGNGNHTTSSLSSSSSSSSSLQRREVVERIRHRQEVELGLTVRDFPMVCISPEKEKILWDKTILREQSFFPSRRYDDHHHHHENHDGDTDIDRTGDSDGNHHHEKGRGNRRDQSEVRPASSSLARLKEAFEWYKSNKRFCSINATKVLEEDMGWIRFFRELE